MNVPEPSLYSLASITPPPTRRSSRLRLFFRRPRLAELRHSFTLLSSFYLPPPYQIFIDIFASSLLHFSRYLHDTFTKPTDSSTSISFKLSLTTFRTWKLPHSQHSRRGDPPASSTIINTTHFHPLQTPYQHLICNHPESFNNSGASTLASLAGFSPHNTLRTNFQGTF